MRGSLAGKGGGGFHAYLWAELDRPAPLLQCRAAASMGSGKQSTADHKDT